MALRIITAWALGLFALLCPVIYLHYPLLFEVRDWWNYLCFIFYLSFYVAFWTTYFSSYRLFKMGVPVISLRVMLRKKSRLWKYEPDKDATFPLSPQIADGEQAPLAQQVKNEEANEEIEDVPSVKLQSSENQEEDHVSQEQQTIDSAINQEIEDVSLEKSKTSTSAIAMLVAASLVALAQARSGWEKLPETLCKPGLVTNQQLFLCQWHKLVIFCLGMSATLALISFIVSADALDTMFNEFNCSGDANNSQANNNYRRYFYQSAINPRYLGLASLVTTIVFINSLINVVLGSISIGLTLAIGLRHWFPNVSLNENAEDPRHWENHSIIRLFLRIFMFAAIPVIIKLFFPRLILYFK